MRIKKRKGAILSKGNIAIVAVLIIAAVIFYHVDSFSKEAEAQQEAMELVFLANAIREISFQPRRHKYQTSAISDLIQRGKTFPTLTPGPHDGVLINRWGGLIYIIGQDGGTNFAIDYQRIPEGICFTLLASMRTKSGLFRSVGHGMASSTASPSSLSLNRRGPPEEIKQFCDQIPSTKTVFFSTRGVF